MCKTLCWLAVFLIFTKVATQSIEIRNVIALLVESVGCGMKGTRIKPQLTTSVFVCFHWLLSAFLKFLARSNKIVLILEPLDKSLAKIRTKGFTKMQDSYQVTNSVFNSFWMGIIYYYSFSLLLQNSLSSILTLCEICPGTLWCFVSLTYLFQTREFHNHTISTL